MTCCPRLSFSSPCASPPPSSTSAASRKYFTASAQSLWCVSRVSRIFSVQFSVVRILVCVCWAHVVAHALLLSSCLATALQHVGRVAQVFYRLGTVALVRFACCMCHVLVVILCLAAFPPCHLVSHSCSHSSLSSSHCIFCFFSSLCVYKSLTVSEPCYLCAHMSMYPLLIFKFVFALATGAQDHGTFVTSQVNEVQLQCPRASISRFLICVFCFCVFFVLLDLCERISI